MKTIQSAPATAQRETGPLRSSSSIGSWRLMVADWLVTYVVSLWIRGLLPVTDEGDGGAAGSRQPEHFRDELAGGVADCHRRLGWEQPRVDHHVGGANHDDRKPGAGK